MKKLLTTLIILTLALFLFASCSGKEPEAPEEPKAPVIPESDPGEANYVIINVRGFGEITVELNPEFAPLTVERFVENVRSGFYTGRNFHRVISDFMIQGGSYNRQGGGDPNVRGVFTETHPDARHYYGAFCLAANEEGYGSDSFYIVNNKDPETFEKLINNVALTIAQYQIELHDIIENEQEYVEEFGQERVDAVLEFLNENMERLTEQLEEFNNTPDEVKARYAEVGGVPFLDGGYTVFGYTIDGFDVIDAISAVPVELSDPLRSDSERSKPTQEIIIEWIIVKTSLD
ncbi:MAG: peptidylprolyl isomerase [Oscillospiraceae bacterium]|jgi:peptidyl-prolyl cis-trans isomerase A (cyclophilin A)/peptidyl-prolyl cis-trans isomerase B (cyclophilin B)|nr:peptidylprolyl isomerase [Oscillospiraceae bacterium]